MGFPTAFSHTGITVGLYVIVSKDGSIMTRGGPNEQLTIAEINLALNIYKEIIHNAIIKNQAVQPEPNNGV
jgi:hypothetical protein